MPVRRRWMGMVGALVVALGSVVVLAPPGGAAGTLDQSQEATPNTAFPGLDWWYGQTFTAGITGNLDQVDVPLSRRQEPGDLVVQIRTVASELPSSTVLASEVVPKDSVPRFPEVQQAWIPVPLDPPVAVVAGTQYALVLGVEVDDPAGALDGYLWGFASGDPYPGGVAVQSAASPELWSALLEDEEDFAFKTYVTAGVAPTDGIPVCIRPDLDLRAPYANGTCPSGFRLAVLATVAEGGTPVCVKTKTDWRAPYKNGTCPSGMQLVRVATVPSGGELVCTKVGLDVRAPDPAGCPAGFTAVRLQVGDPA